MVQRRRSLGIALCAACTAALLGLWGQQAVARSVEPGTTSLGLGIGPSFSLGTPLGTSLAYGSVAVEAEYAFDYRLAALVDVLGNFGSNTNLRIHIGPRWHLGGSGAPLLPVAQAQLTLGRLFDVLGADLQFYGGRLGGGIEYFALQNVSVAAIAAVDLGTTAGERPAFASFVDVSLTATYAF